MEVIGQLYTPGGFNPRKVPLYPLSSGLGGPQRRSGRFKEDKKLWSLPGIERRMVQREVPPLYWLCYTFLYEHYTKHF
jgi:hypothetical protein